MEENIKSNRKALHIIEGQPFYITDYYDDDYKKRAKKEGALGISIKKLEKIMEQNPANCLRFDWNSVCFFVYIKGERHELIIPGDDVHDYTKLERRDLFWFSGYELRKINGLVEKTRRALEEVYPLNISEVFTIQGKCIDEMPFDNFCKKLKSKMKKSPVTYIEYCEDDKRFYIGLEGINYELKLDEKEIKNYESGIYSEITGRLQELINYNYKKQLNKSKIDGNEKQELEILQQIENADTTPTLANAPIYMRYLRKQNKENLKEITKGIGKLSPYSLPFLIPTAIIASISFNDLAFMLWMLSVCGVAASGVSLFSREPVSKAMNDIKGIIAAVKEYKLNKHKMKQIKSMSNYKEIVEPVSYTVESFDKTMDEKIKTDEQNFEDRIMKEINMVINRIDCTAIEDRKTLLEETKSILDEYSSRYKGIQGQEKDNSIELTKDNEFSLQKDILSRISSLEMKLSDSKDKTTKISFHENERQLLEKKIRDAERRAEEIDIDEKPPVRKRKKDKIDNCSWNRDLPGSWMN